MLNHIPVCTNNVFHKEFVARIILSGKVAQDTFGREVDFLWTEYHRGTHEIDDSFMPQRQCAICYGPTVFALWESPVENTDYSQLRYDEAWARVGLIKTWNSLHTNTPTLHVINSDRQQVVVKTPKFPVEAISHLTTPVGIRDMAYYLWVNIVGRQYTIGSNKRQMSNTYGVTGKK